MKFGRRVQEEAYEPYRPNYIAYKELKKAIKLITGNDTSNCTISEVTSCFGGLTGLDEFANRPPEAQFQNLLNFEVEKINKFSTLTYASLCSRFQDVLNLLRACDEASRQDEALRLKAEAEVLADEVAELHAYVRLNFIGFRKITKKYDKHSDTAASCWYLARILREKFMALDFDYLVELTALCFSQLQKVLEGGINNETNASAWSNSNTPGDLATDCHLEDMTHSTYFVGEEHLMRVRIQLAKHVPLVAVGASSLCQQLLLPPGMCTEKEEGENAAATDLSLLRRSSGGMSEQTPIEVPAKNSEQISPIVTEQQSRRRFSFVALPSRGMVDGCRDASTASQSVFYKRGSDRVSTSCLYFDNPSTFPKYHELMSLSADENSTYCLRFRWTTSPPVEPQIVTLADEPLSPQVKGGLGSTASSGQFHSTPSMGAASLLLPASVVIEFCPAFAPPASPHEWWQISSCPLAQSSTAALLRHKSGFAQFVVPRQVAESLLNGTFDLEGYLTTATVPESRSVDDVRAFFTRVMYAISEKKQVPVVQEWVHRTTFQKVAETRDRPYTVYMTLDDNIRFADAQRRKQHTSTSGETACGYWAPPHFSGSTVEEDIRPCSFGILSLSYWGSKRPAFLPRITGLTSVSEVWRYAPLLHGVSTFHADRFPFKSRPDWFKLIVSEYMDEGKQHDAAAGDWKETRRSSEKRRAIKKGSVDNGARIRVDVMSTKPRDRVLHEHALHLQQQNHPNRAEVLSNSSAVSAPRSAVAPYQMAEHINVPYHELPTPAARNSGLREPFLLPLSTSTNTPSFSTGSFGELIRRLKRRIITFFQWFVYRYFYSDTLVSGQATVRVEPKTFFANERTLLQWLNTAVLLSTISITLLNFGSPSGRRAGLIMAPVALFFIAYAYCVYLRRSYSLEQKKPINYNDRLGPAILVLSLIGALSAIIILNITTSPLPPNSADAKGLAPHRVPPPA